MPTPAVIRRLDEHLVLRHVQDDDDVRRFAAFNQAVNGADQGATCTALLRGHPTVRREHFWMVEDTQRGEIVSTTCLIPWRCQWGDVSLTVAMLEMVVTHPDYRRRGLVRAQIDHFHHTVQAQGFDLAIIEGIPYYYRQFGYGYALDHWPTLVLPSPRIPADAATLELRAAGEADVPLLQTLYDPAAGNGLWVSRSAADWRYLLHAARYPIYLLLPPAGGAALGYVAGWRRGDNGQTAVLMESGIATAQTALALLRHIQATCAEVWLGGFAHNTLAQVATGLGAQPMAGGQWLLRVVDMHGLLAKLAPLFAARLAASAWAGFSGAFLLNLYRQAYRLRFVAGRLAGVDAVGFVDASMGADGGDLAIPPDAFLRLLLGYRSLEQLRDAWPDIVVRPARHSLAAALFPQFDAQMWLPYMHCGHLTPLLEA